MESRNDAVPMKQRYCSEGGCGTADIVLDCPGHQSTRKCTSRSSVGIDFVREAQLGGSERKRKAVLGSCSHSEIIVAPESSDDTKRKYRIVWLKNEQ